MNRASLLSAVVLATTISGVVGLGMISPLVPGAPEVSAQPQPQPKPAPNEDRIGFPEGYQNWTLFYVYDRPDNKTLRIVYANEPAAAASTAAPPNQAFPYGSILVMEVWQVQQDADGKVLLDANGRFMKDESQAPGVFVMRKEPGFGEAYQISRAGEWEWVVYRTDGSYQTPPSGTNGCATCHQDAGATKDWVMRANLYFYGESGALPTATNALAQAGRIPMQSFLFLPDDATIARGSMITWTNDDPLAHTVTAADRSWDAGRVGPGGTYSRTFDQPGTIEYVCTLHQGMRGKITVTG